MTHQPDEKFDWNRVGLDGKPRELHVAQSLASIDFSDFEPKLVETKFVADGRIQRRPLVNDPLFNVETWKLNSGAGGLLKPKKLQILVVTASEIEIKSGLERRTILPDSGKSGADGNSGAVRRGVVAR